MTAQLRFDKKHHRYICSGNWLIQQVGTIEKQFKMSSSSRNKTIVFVAEQLTHFDSAGALLLVQWTALLKKNNNKIEFEQFTKQQLELIELVQSKYKALDYTPPKSKQQDVLYRIGVETVNKLHQVKGLLILVGDLTDKLWVACRQWRRFQFPSIVSNIESAGFYALPIIGLLSFLIGVVLAYQMGLQLETYGATSFIAYLSGMAIFREFGPLITAILIAGRTGSAFTAQIGSMKINEEIDALRTMGLSPTELIVVPKVLALLLVFPLLIFWSNVFGILGAMFMSKMRLNVGYYDYLLRLQDSVGLKQMMLGLYKAPTFAILIALVGCFQGFRVQANADSVGSQTTRSVVQALFLIIVTDAAYSIIYSWMGL